jgi:peptide/nickel transport system permease protein
MSQSNQSKSLYSIAIARLKRNRLAMFGVYIIIFSSVVAILGGNIRSDSTKDANNQILSIQRKPPGFKVDILKVRKNKLFDGDFFWNALFAGGRENQYKEIAIYDYWFEGSDIVVEEFTGKNEDIPGKQIAFNLADVIFSIDTKKEYSQEKSLKKCNIL